MFALESISRTPSNCTALGLAHARYPFVLQTVDLIVLAQSYFDSVTHPSGPTYPPIPKPIPKARSLLLGPQADP